MAAQPLPGLPSHAGFRKGYPPSLTCLFPVESLSLFLSPFVTFSYYRVVENSCFFFQAVPTFEKVTIYGKM
jgi:hypothetical protein